MDFLPYVFQLMSQLLHLTPAGRGKAVSWLVCSPQRACAQPSPATRVVQAVGGPGQNLSPAYVSLLKPLLNASMWDRKGNVPSLVALMSVSATPQRSTMYKHRTDDMGTLLQGYMRQGHAYIAANNMVVPILGVFQKLLSARTTEMHGFMLLSCATSEFSLYV